MCIVCRVATGGMAIAVALTPTVNMTAPNESKSDAKKAISVKIFSEIKSPSSLSSFKVPDIQTPDWHSTSQSSKKSNSGAKKKSHIQYQQRAMSDQICLNSRNR